jgi:hypothetical protein
MAEGQIDAEQAAHLAGCADCGRRVEQMRTLLAALAYPLRAAPEGLLDRVPNPVPAPKITRLARLLGYGPALAARAVVDDVQVLVGTEDVELRLIYARQADGIRVMGRLPEGGWTLEDGAVEIDFVAASEAATGFALEREDMRLEVPALDALRADGTGGTR